MKEGRVNNFFENYERTHGYIYAPSQANIFIGRLQKNDLNSTHLNPFICLHYIGDIFLILTHEKSIWKHYWNTSKVLFASNSPGSSPRTTLQSQMSMSDSRTVDFPIKSTNIIKCLYFQQFLFISHETRSPIRFCCPGHQHLFL